MTQEIQNLPQDIDCEPRAAERKMRVKMLLIEEKLNQ